MRLLLDTHVVLWAIVDSAHLSETAAAAISDPSNEVMISSVVPWEFSIKDHVGKLPEAEPLLADFNVVCEALRAEPLPIEMKHGIFAGQLDWPHKDPFDRMLAAQAILEGSVLVTRDRVFATYSPLAWLW